jgi:hypothetical protein
MSATLKRALGRVGGDAVSPFVTAIAMRNMLSWFTFSQSDLHELQPDGAIRMPLN